MNMVSVRVRDRVRVRVSYMLRLGLGLGIAALGDSEPPWLKLTIVQCSLLTGGAVW